MPEPIVRLVGKNLDEVLGERPTQVPAQELVLSVSNHRSRTIVVDGDTRRLSAGSTGLLPMDLKRSTGYHRVQIDQTVVWFATQDSKLALTGIAAMLPELAGLGTGWTGQVMFSDGSGYRDPHVVYGWLEGNADAALDAITSILTAPRSETETRDVLSRRGGAAVRAVPTLRHLRADPRHNLTPREGGLLRIGEQAYDPVRVVVRQRRLTVHTIPNRRAAQLLDHLANYVNEVLGAATGEATTIARCRIWRERIHALQARPLTRALGQGPSVKSAPRQTVELNDRRYQRVFEATRDLQAHFGWSPTADVNRRYSYILRADVIYQAYAATRLAAELGLTQTSPVLGSIPLAFSGPIFDLYYDTSCPPHVLRSWRHGSIAPDSSKPDLLLHERATGRVAVIDAKYRIGPDGFASEDSRKDVEAYLSLYGLRAVTILYPGDAATERTVAAMGQSILEVPVKPGSPALAAAMPAILASLDAPPY